MISFIVNRKPEFQTMKESKKKEEEKASIAFKL
jgi:hypothetical protein